MVLGKNDNPMMITATLLNDGSSWASQMGSRASYHTPKFPT